MFLRSGRLTKMTELENSKELGDEERDLNTNEPEKNEITSFENSPYIVAFDPDIGMTLELWLKYFEKICGESGKKEDWKLRNVHKYLKGKALTEYIHASLEISKWDELCSLLKEKFLKATDLSLSDFTKLTYNVKSDLEKYFKEKLEIGRKLGLKPEMLLEGLTDGLPPTLKQLITVNPPSTPTDWFHITSKLVKMQDCPNNPKYQQQPQQNFTRPQFRYNQPQYYQRPQYEQRQWRPGFRNYTPHNYQGTINNPHMRNPRVESPRHVHYQQRLPPSPCRICEERGIPNAFHWAQVCPFRRQFEGVNLTDSSEVPKESEIKERASVDDNSQ